MNGNEDIKLTLRIPKFLHTKLEKRRAKTRRSLNQEIVILLERFVESIELTVMEGGQEIASKEQISSHRSSPEDNRLRSSEKETPQRTIAQRMDISGQEGKRISDSEGKKD